MIAPKTDLSEAPLELTSENQTVEKHAGREISAIMFSANVNKQCEADNLPSYIKYLNGLGGAQWQNNEHGG